MPSPGITKKMMASAMKEFMAKRPLSKISVGDIVEHCGLNRNTFYYHFKDKYDLVNWIFYTEFVAEMNWDESDSTWQVIEKLTRFLYENRSFYHNALSEQGANSFTEYFGEIVKAAVLARIEDLIEDRQFRDFYANFFVDAFIACISRWLREGAQIPPDMLAQLMKKAATGAAVMIVQDMESDG